MKSVYFLLTGAICTLVLSLLGIRAVLSSNAKLSEVPSDKATAVHLSESLSEQPPKIDPTKTTYANGLATFVYDATQLIWEEIPSDEDNGLPMASFFLLDGGAALPRVDIFPAKLRAPFSEGQAEAEWTSFAREMVLAYYTPEERDQIALNMGEPVVKIEDGITKTYITFEAVLEQAPEYSMAGSVRMLANDAKASITISAHQPGESLPGVLYDLAMSQKLG